MASGAWQTTFILVSERGGGRHRAGGRHGRRRRAAPRPPRHTLGRDETTELRKNLLTVESIIKAEPQVLVFWEQGHGVRVMVHTLAGVAGPARARSASS